MANAVTATTGIEDSSFPSEGESLKALAGLERHIALRVEQIMKKLHVQLVILDDQDLLGHLPTDSQLTFRTRRENLPSTFIPRISLSTRYLSTRS